MLNLTLDHNCLIYLENATGESAAIRELIALHRSGQVRVHVGVISASENVRGGADPTYANFSAWVERLGISDLPRVLPEARVGMSYYDQSVIAGDDDLEDRVREVVHPSLVDFETFALERGMDPHGPIQRKWRNRTCDIDGMVAHIRRGHDVFVTEDRHFLDHGEALAALGAGKVLTPQQTLREMQANG